MPSMFSNMLYRLHNFLPLHKTDPVRQVLATNCVNSASIMSCNLCLAYSCLVHVNVRWYVICTHMHMCRITLRVVYSSGESKDSNPIIASLDSVPGPRHLHPSPLTEAEVEIEADEGKPKPHLNQSELPHDNGSGLLVAANQFHQLSGTDSLGCLDCTITTTTVLNSCEKSDLGGERGWGEHHASNVSTQHQFAKNVVETSVGVTTPPRAWVAEAPTDTPTQSHVSCVTHTGTVMSAVISSASGGGVDIHSQQNIPGVLDPCNRQPSTNNLMTDNPSAVPAKEGDLFSEWSASAQKGDSAEKDNHMKPFMTKPPPSLEASGMQTMTTTPSTSLHTCSTASYPSVVAPSPSHAHPSPIHSHNSVGLLQPITTSSLVTSAISSPYLPQVSLSVTTKVAADAILPLSGAQYMPSMALVQETKQPPPLPITTDVLAMATPGEGFQLISTPLYLQDSIGEVATTTMVTDVEGPVAASNVSHSRGMNTLNTTLSGGVVSSGELGDSTLTSSAEGSHNITSHPARASDAEKSTLVEESHPDGAGGSGCLLTGGDDGSGSTRCSNESEIKSWAFECKQLTRDCEKCFEHHPFVPRKDSDSIIPLAEATAKPGSSSVGTQASYPPQGQTMPLAFFQEEPQALPTFNNEGGDSGRDREQEDGAGGGFVGGVESVGSSSSSIHMASVLLSQLEADLTNSLNESNT